MAALYDITETILAVVENGYRVDEKTGEYWDLDSLDELQMELDEKLENIGALIKNIESDAAAIDAEKKNLDARAKSLKKKAESLRNYVGNSMTAIGMDRFSSPRVAFGFRKSSKVEIVDEDVVPSEFCHHKWVPDKALIKKAISSGHVVNGAQIVENRNLQVK